MMTKKKKKKRKHLCIKTNVFKLIGIDFEEADVLLSRLEFLLLYIF